MIADGLLDAGADHHLGAKENQVAEQSSRWRATLRDGGSVDRRGLGTSPEVPNAGTILCNTRRFLG